MASLSRRTRSVDAARGLPTCRDHLSGGCVQDEAVGEQDSSRTQTARRLKGCGAAGTIAERLLKGLAKSMTYDR